MSETITVTTPRHLGSAGAVREVLKRLGVFREGMDAASFIRVLNWRIEDETIKMTATTDMDVRTLCKIFPDWRVKSPSRMKCHKITHE